MLVMVVVVMVGAVTGLGYSLGLSRTGVVDFRSRIVGSRRFTGFAGFDRSRSGGFRFGGRVFNSSRFGHQGGSGGDGLCLDHLRLFGQSSAGQRQNDECESHFLVNFSQLPDLILKLK
jgi:hypothetical protein